MSGLIALRLLPDNLRTDATASHALGNITYLYSFLHISERICRVELKSAVPDITSYKHISKYKYLIIMKMGIIRFTKYFRRMKYMRGKIIENF